MSSKRTFQAPKLAIRIDMTRIVKVCQRVGSRSKKNYNLATCGKKTTFTGKQNEKQRTMYQMKEQDKTPEKQLNEVEIGKLPEKEFRIMIVKMIKDSEKNGGKDREDTRNV